MRRVVAILLVLSALPVAGAVRSELEAAFIDSIAAYVAEAPRLVELPSEEALVADVDSLWRLPGDWIVDEAISSDLIFDRDDEGFFLVDAPEYPDATIQNLLCGSVPEDFDLRLDLEVITQKYGSSRKLNVSAEAFIAYALKHGCRPYWGLEELDWDVVRGALFLADEERGIVHLLRLEGNPKELGEPEMTLRGKAYLFIPTNNVKTLYGEKDNE
ncbi:MAG: hypothetical protein K2M06_01390 [Muribaculaceae bacterium]|nr:hypothetical protein [Muribaculaceae bacterium]